MEEDKRALSPKSDILKPEEQIISVGGDSIPNTKEVSYNLEGDGISKFGKENTMEKRCFETQLWNIC